MENAKKTENPLCDSCRKLVGAGRHTKPHSNLEKTNFNPIKSMHGSVDETDYTCRVCEKKWLHETGSYGQGWVG